MITATITQERRAFLSKIGRKGGRSRAQAFTSDFQRHARACVSHEANVANGRKGGIAYVRKYGKRKLVEQARQYRLAHPSDLERTVEVAMIEIGACGFERESYIFPTSRCHHNTGDFLFRKLHKIVYADGAAWHSGKELPTSFVNCVDRAMRDERLDNYLRYRGWQVLRLSEQEIRAHLRGTDAGAMLERLKDFVLMEVPFERRRDQTEQIATQRKASTSTDSGRGPGEGLPQGCQGAPSEGSNSLHCGGNQAADRGRRLRRPGGWNDSAERGHEGTERGERGEGGESR